MDRVLPKLPRSLRSIILRAVLVSVGLSFAAAAVGAWISATVQEQDEELIFRKTIHETLGGVLAPAMSVSDFSEVRRILTLATKPSDFFAVVSRDGDVLLADYTLASTLPSVLTEIQGPIDCTRAMELAEPDLRSGIRVHCSELKDAGPFGGTGHSPGLLLSIEINGGGVPLNLAILGRLLVLALAIVPTTAGLILWVLRKQVINPLSRLHDGILRSAAMLDDGVLPDNHVGVDPSAPKEVHEIGVSYVALLSRIKDYSKRQADLERDSAIARMTGMLAHDVRKPFSILRMGLGMLSGAKDPASVKAVLSRLVPEIDKAVSSVDGLIADVMEVGSTSTQLIQEPVSPESLIEATLGEICRLYPKTDATISYDLRHTHMASVHVQKVGRVFSNIVGNAIQAIGYKGDIWFKTTEQDGMIEFCLGNAGSLIPAESLPKLFDAFFTSGKKGGTGLGLAIAQKVVIAHGGRIRCESSKTMDHPDGKVEFFFSLPVAKGYRSKTTATLPLHSSDITKAIMAMAHSGQVKEGNVDRGELTLEEDIIQARVKLERPVRVLVVDDEAFYRSALVAYLSRTPDLSASIQLVQVEGSNRALGELAKCTFDLVITDVDMGPDSLDGFELVREMRALGLVSLICVHSNRVVAADHKTAIQTGADAFLPKPVARAQLLKLVLQAVEAAHEASLASKRPSVEAQCQGAVVAPTEKPEILIVDDNIFILEAWRDALQSEATVHALPSLEALSERLEADPEFAGRLLLAVTDLNLDGSAGDGLDVGRLLKRYHPQLRVLLSSDGIIPPGNLQGAIDLAIGKEPVGLGALSAH